MILFDETKPQGRPVRHEAAPGRLYATMAAFALGDRPRVALSPVLFPRRGRGLALAALAGGGIVVAMILRMAL